MYIYSYCKYRFESVSYVFNIFFVLVVTRDVNTSYADESSVSYF